MCTLALISNLSTTHLCGQIAHFFSMLCYAPNTYTHTHTHCMCVCMSVCLSLYLCVSEFVFTHVSGWCPQADRRQRMKGIAHSLEEEVEGESGQDSADRIVSKYASRLWLAVLYSVQYCTVCRALYYYCMRYCTV